MRGFFLGFPGYRDQSALSFLKGRSSRFLQFLCLFNHVEVNFLFVSVWFSFFVSSGILRLLVLDFLILFGYYCEYCIFFDEDSFSFFLCSSLFCKRCVFYVLVCCFVYFWCAGSVRISLAGRVIYFLCGTPLCGVPGRYNLFEC